MRKLSAYPSQKKLGWLQAEDVRTLMKERRQRRVRVVVKLTVAATGQKKSSPKRCDSASRESPEKRL